MAENNKTRFFYVLYSDKTRVFDQSQRAYYPIYVINDNIEQFRTIYFSAFRFNFLLFGCYSEYMYVKFKNFTLFEFHIVSTLLVRITKQTCN